jgi:hypothetical protein
MRLDLGDEVILINGDDGLPAPLTDGGKCHETPHLARRQSRVIPTYPPGV